MNREIKFREWLPEKKRMNDNFFIWSDGTLNSTSESNNAFVMQFTGVKDKNGVDIYEGDIVKDSQLDQLQVVFFADSSYQMGREGEKTQYDKRNKLWGEYVEVLGNIYEHGYLLELRS